MDAIDRPTIQRSATGLVDEVKLQSPQDAAEKLAHYGGAEVAAVLVKLNPGYAQDVLGALPADTRERALAAAPVEFAHQWQRNALYAEDTIGRMMEPVYAAFPPQATVGHAIEALHELVKQAFITYIYVVDEDERLLGIVTMRDLLFNEHATALRDVMLTEVFALHAPMLLDDAMKHVLARHYPVYPVVDAENRLRGLVRGQSMFEARAFDIAAQPGSMVGVDKEERVATPHWQSFRMRHPWLQINLFTAFGTAAVVSTFGATIEKVVVLAAFLPVLSCLAGNNGCQALAITLRGLTMGDMEKHPVRELIRKELRVGALNGLFTGIVGGIAMYLFARSSGEDSPVLLALIMLVAMIVTCVLSCLLGTVVPLAMRRLGADPATASSIFLLTFTDIIGMGFMLVLATLFLV